MPCWSEGGVYVNVGGKPEEGSGWCPGGLGLLDLFQEEQEGQDVRAEREAGLLEEEKQSPNRLHKNLGALSFLLGETESR